MYYMYGKCWRAIVKAKEISTMATMSCEFSWTIVSLLFSLYVSFFHVSLSHSLTHAFLHLPHLSPHFFFLITSYLFAFVYLYVRCFHKWIFYFSVLFLLTMSAFSFIWMLLLLFYHLFCECIFHFRRALRRLNPFTSSFSSASSKRWLLKLSLTFHSFYHRNILLYLFTVVANCAHWSNLIYHCVFDFIFGICFTIAPAIAPVNNPKSIIYKTPIYNNQTKKKQREEHEVERERKRRKNIYEHCK